MQKKAAAFVDFSSGIYGAFTLYDLAFFPHLSEKTSKEEEGGRMEE